MGLGAGALAFSGLPRWSGLQAAPNGNRTLVHILLEGGPDFRHLLVPKPSSDTKSYGYKFWNNRITTTGRGSSANNPNRWNEIFSRFYEEINLGYQDGRGGSQVFGVLKDNNGRANANGWLIAQIKAGNVAIVNNVQHSTSRDHHHSLLVLQSGNYETNAGSANAGGWGGRLVGELGAGAKLVSFTRAIRPFCNTSNKAQILSFTNSRNFGLLQPGVNTQGRLNRQDRSVRALQQYYATLGDSHFTGPYKKFGDQRKKIQGLTETIRSALPSPAQGENFSDVFSDRIKNLLEGDSQLNNRDFARQIANLRDAFQVQSSLGMRVASLNYGGWDSHKNQITDIEPQFDDLFGTDKGLDALTKEFSGIMDNSVFAFTGDFGRQLKSNGDNGTDHGRGNTILLIGNKVRGGVYGEMFPELESAEDGSGKALFDQFNRDIEGRTTFDSVLGSVCTWVRGSASSVFANSNITGQAVNNGRSNGQLEIRTGTTPISLNLFTA